ncbi:FixH family protein [Parasphingorhabdus sp.]|uniref:FixH family protein n=1 Tax=Parasphingorhabdus sp. TaxID=2709688 RepID=UPI003263149B
MSKPKPTPRRINGFHATWMFIAFFGVIFAVNMLMARFAVSSFGGTVVDNSYVASQNYNKWLEEGRQQASHGWSFSKASRSGEQLIFSAIAEDQNPLESMTLSAEVSHPVGRTETFELTFGETAPGQYRSIEAVPAGRWKLKVRALRDGQAFNFLDEIK